jgi:hypothetical protein
MRKALLTTGLAAALAAITTAIGMIPASAVSAGVFEGTATIDCFGCGDSQGTAALCLTGVAADEPDGGVPPTPPPVPTPEPTLAGPSVCLPDSLGSVGGPNVSATYTVHEGTDVDCVISGSAEGTTTGAVVTSFNWNRVGAVAQINTSSAGNGVALFVVTGPAGLPCGAHNLTAYVVGELNDILS